MDHNFRSALAWAMLRHDAQVKRRESILAYVHEYVDHNRTIEEITRSISDPRRRAFESALALTFTNLASLDFLRQVGAYSEAQLQEMDGFWRPSYAAFEGNGDYRSLPEAAEPLLTEDLEQRVLRWTLGHTANEVVADLQGDHAATVRRQVLFFANLWRFSWLDELGLSADQVKEMERHMVRLFAFYEDYLHPAALV